METYGSVAVTDQIRRTVNFTVRDGATEIFCCITFEARQWLSRVSGNVTDAAGQLFNRHSREIESAAIARYAAGDFDRGVVHLDRRDFSRILVIR